MRFKLLKSELQKRLLVDRSLSHWSNPAGTINLVLALPRRIDKKGKKKKKEKMKRPNWRTTRVDEDELRIDESRRKRETSEFPPG